MSQSTFDWFPSGKDDNKGWRLDIVSLLALVGESTVGFHLQSITASRYCLLPRLVPAPQAFLRWSRERRLPAFPGCIVGVHSGSRVEEVNYFANVLHDVENLSRYEFRVYRVKWRAASRRPRGDEEKAKPTRSHTSGAPRPMIPPSRFSPINIVTIVTFVVTCGILIWAGVIHDGAALLATVLMSGASTLVCYARLWHPRLAKRPHDGPVPPGDIVIKTRDGAIVVVECSEECARELYIGSENCDYFVGEGVFKTCSGTAVLFIMIAVILLGNCSWTMQAVVGAVYLILNGVYWVVALLPQSWFWDLSRYESVDITPHGMRRAHSDTLNNAEPRFTRTLWYAIRVTKSTRWVRLGHVAPATEQWDEWLRLAEENCEDEKWPAEAELQRLVADHASKCAIR